MNRRDDLIEIFNDTMAWIASEPELKGSVKNSIAGTKLYMQGDTPALSPDLAPHDTSLHVSSDRSFEAAMRLRKKYPDAKIAVHNFASATNPGGGVTTGAVAQEECLCRCSTLYPTLTPLFGSYYQYHRSRSDVRYTDACIWSPDIIIVKTDEEFPQRMKKHDWCTVDILTCAAPNLRPKPNNRMNPGNNAPIHVSDGELLELHKSRARHMLSIASANGDDVLVLGAFGCGAFKNDPRVVAKAYKEVLSEFKGRFLHVEFAVYCTPRSSENYDAFKRVLG